MLLNKKWQSFLVFLTLLCYVNNYRILGVFPVAIRSHFILGSSLMKSFAEAGHDVTIIAPFREENLDFVSKNGSYREIILEREEERMRNWMKDSAVVTTQSAATMKTMRGFLTIMKNSLNLVVEETVNDSKVQELIHSGEKFDVVIVAEFLETMLRALSVHFDASLVLFTNFGAVTLYYDQVGNIVLPSISPVHFTSFPVMSFTQRLQNTFDKIEYMRWKRSEDLYQNELMKKYFPQAPTLKEISKNISLVLANTHFSTEVARQATPCIINIGGFHLKPHKELPHDLQQLINNAKAGVIYFSFGTIVDPQIISQEKLNGVLEMLGKRKETVLWKYSGHFEKIPKNVVIRKWFPQQDILAHPNVKLFITHSGYLSTTETTYYGVPTISVPFVADQELHAMNREKIGCGVVISVENFSNETLGKAIEEVISNPKYREAAKDYSRIMRDRPNKPVDDAIFWVEYVVRHRGAKHLRVPYLDMPLYQIYMLDIIGLFFFVSLVCALIFLFIVIKLKMLVQKYGTQRVDIKKKRK